MDTNFISRQMIRNGHNLTNSRKHAFGVDAMFIAHCSDTEFRSFSRSFRSAKMYFVAYTYEDIRPMALRFFGQIGAQIIFVTLAISATHIPFLTE